MAPPRKPAARRQRRNTTKTTKLKVVAGGGASSPAAPRELLVATKKQWVEFWDSPIAKAVNAAVDLAAVERLFTLIDERERAQRVFRKKRLVKGSQGQLVLNPLGRHIASLDAEIRQLEDRFGRTPMARLKLGIELGDDDGPESLDDLNEELNDDEEDDPRLRAVEGGRAAASAKPR